MYDELIKRLREHAEFLTVSDRMKAPPNVNVKNLFAEDMAQAADAIEELSRQLAEYHSYDGFLMMHGCFVELPEPPKEES